MVGGDFEVFGEADFVGLAASAPSFVAGVDNEDLLEFEAFGAVSGEEVNGLLGTAKVEGVIEGNFIFLMGLDEVVEEFRDGEVFLVLADCFKEGVEDF